MKIIRFLTGDPNGPIDFHPDSALLLPGRPMFHPDFGDEWHVSVFLAVRINRLGKSVGEKFAPRYYDALSIGIRIEPESVSPADEGALSGMDCTITYGEWIKPEEFLANGSFEIAGLNVEQPHTSDCVDRAVSALSRLTTIKMGDILLLPLRSPAIILHPRSYITATTNTGNEILSVKVV